MWLRKQDPNNNNINRNSRRKRGKSHMIVFIDKELPQLITSERERKKEFVSPRAKAFNLLSDTKLSVMKLYIYKQH